MKAEKQKLMLEIIASGNYSATISGDILSSREIPMAGNLMPNGYRMYTLRHNGETKMVYGHQFVWLYFKGEYDPSYVIDHIDHNRANNYLENLRCVTQSENLKGDWRKTKRSFPRVRISDNQRERIRKLNSEGVSAVIISKSLGISRQSIGKILK